MAKRSGLVDYLLKTAKDEYAKANGLEVSEELNKALEGKSVLDFNEVYTAFSGTNEEAVVNALRAEKVTRKIVSHFGYGLTYGVFCEKLHSSDNEMVSLLRANYYFNDERVTKTLAGMIKKGYRILPDEIFTVREQILETGSYKPRDALFEISERKRIVSTSTLEYAIKAGIINLPYEFRMAKDDVLKYTIIDNDFKRLVRFTNSYNSIKNAIETVIELNCPESIDDLLNTSREMIPVAKAIGISKGVEELMLDYNIVNIVKNKKRRALKARLEGMKYLLPCDSMLEELSNDFGIDYIPLFFDEKLTINAMKERAKYLAGIVEELKKKGVRTDKIEENILDLMLSITNITGEIHKKAGYSEKENRIHIISRLSVQEKDEYPFFEFEEFKTNDGLFEKQVKEKIIENLALAGSVSSKGVRNCFYEWCEEALYVLTNKREYDPIDSLFLKVFEPTHDLEGDEAFLFDAHKNLKTGLSNVLNDIYENISAEYLDFVRSLSNKQNVITRRIRHEKNSSFSFGEFSDEELLEMLQNGFKTLKNETSTTMENAKITAHGLDYLESFFVSLPSKRDSLEERLLQGFINPFLEDVERVCLLGEHGETLNKLSEIKVFRDEVFEGLDKNVIKDLLSDGSIIRKYDAYFVLGSNKETENLIEDELHGRLVGKNFRDIHSLRAGKLISFVNNKLKELDESVFNNLSRSELANFAADSVLEFNSLVKDLEDNFILKDSENVFLLLKQLGRYVLTKRIDRTLRYR